MSKNIFLFEIVVNPLNIFLKTTIYYLTLYRTTERLVVLTIWVFKTTKAPDATPMSKTMGVKSENGMYSSDPRCLLKYLIFMESFTGTS